MCVVLFLHVQLPDKGCVVVVLVVDWQDISCKLFNVGDPERAAIIGPRNALAEIGVGGGGKKDRCEPRILP